MPVDNNILKAVNKNSLLWIKIQSKPLLNQYQVQYMQVIIYAVINKIK